MPKYSKVEANEIAQKFLVAAMQHHNELLLTYFREDWKAFYTAARNLKYDATNLVSLHESLKQ